MVQQLGPFSYPARMMGIRCVLGRMQSEVALKARSERKAAYFLGKTSRITSIGCL
jgi:hypothetical protein